MDAAAVCNATQNLAQALQELVEALASPPEKQHYTIPEAVELLGVTRKTVLSHIRAGDFGGVVQLDTRHYLIPAQGLRDYMASRTRYGGRRPAKKHKTPRTTGYPGPI